MQKRVLWCALYACLGLTLAVVSSAQPGPIDTRGWGVAKFIDHLRATGLRVHVVPSRADGHWGSTVYLSEDPEATWHSFQHKSRNVESIGQWRGAVWVEHLRPEGDTDWDVSPWGSNGCQIDRFVVFGDARLVARVQEAFYR